VSTFRTAFDPLLTETSKVVRYSMPDVSKSIVLITGCDSGFGALSAVELSDSGYRVVAACLTEDGVARLDQKVTLGIVCDVTKEDDVTKLATAIEKLASDENLSLWAVVNNAGVAPIGYIDWFSMATIKKIMEVCYMSSYAVNLIRYGK
jgi:NAD(P)-dependent dehydrogenase (short-subunit alcohol dehydrogenase family)